MRWLSRLYNCIIFLLLLCNLSYLLYDYLDYETQTNSAYYYPVVLSVPKLSLCFDLFSFLRGKGVPINGTHVDLTFNRMFDLMPPPHDVVNWCEYRDKTTDVLVRAVGGRRCTEYFIIDKFKMQSFLCYRFTYRPSSQYDFHATINSLYAPRVLYSVNVDSPIIGPGNVLSLLHLDKYPDEERVVERERYTPNNSLFIMTYNSYEWASLPLPYVSGCMEYSQMKCLHYCLNAIYSPRGFLWHSSIVPENSSIANLKPFHEQSESSEINIHNCHKKCHAPCCETNFLVTRQSPAYPGPRGSTFTVSATFQPPLRVETVPGHELGDWLLKAASVASIWLGVSFISLADIVKEKEPSAEQVTKVTEQLYQSLEKIIHRRRRVSIKVKWPPHPKLRWCRLIIRLLAVALMSWQIFTCSSHYFRYQTTMKFWFETDSQVEVANVALCRDPSEVIGFDVTSVTEDNYDDFFRYRDSQTSGLAADLLNRMNTSHLVDRCTLRDAAKAYKTMKNLTAAECRKVLPLTSFFTDRLLCFALLPTVETLPLYRSDVRLMTIQPGLIYSVQFNNNLFFLRVQVFMYFGVSIPNWSMEPTLIVDSHRKRQYSISTQLFKDYLLPSPYETNCKLDTKSTDCYSRCLRSALEPLRLLPYVGWANKRSHFPILSYSDLSNSTIHEFWSRSEVKCQATCRQVPCNNSYTLTYIADEEPWHATKLSVELPARPTSIVEAEAVMHLYDLWYQILCSMSFWIGFSFHSLSPALLIARMRWRAASERFLPKLHLIRHVVDKLTPKTSKRSFKFAKITLPLLTRSIIRVCASVACFQHIYWSMVTYFEYPSYIDLSETAETETNMYLSVCVDPVELALSRARNTRVSSVTTEERTLVLSQSIGALFNSTPDTDSIIKGCSYRGLVERQGKLDNFDNVTDRIVFSTDDPEKCDQIFTVDKFLVTSFMCYAFRPRNVSKLKPQQMEGGLNSARTFHSVKINSSLLTSRFYFLVNYGTFHPFTTSNFAVASVYDAAVNQFGLSYVKFSQKVLPLPRPNLDYLPFIFHRCLDRCIHEHFSPIGRLFSHPSMGDSSEDLKYFTARDRENSSVSDFINKTIVACENYCMNYNDQKLNGSQTDLIIFSSAVSQLTYPDIGPSHVVLKLRSTKMPVFWISFIIRIPVLDQLINIGSIAGVWYGFYLLSLSNLGTNQHVSLAHLNHLQEQVHLLAARADAHCRKSYFTRMKSLPWKKIYSAIHLSHLSHVRSAQTTGGYNPPRRAYRW